MLITCLIFVLYYFVYVQVITPYDFSSCMKFIFEFMIFKQYFHDYWHLKTIENIRNPMYVKV